VAERFRLDQSGRLTARGAGAKSTLEILALAFLKRTLTEMPEDPRSLPTNPQGLTRVGDGVVAFFAAHEEARQPARRRDLHFNAMPLTVVVKVRGLVANRVLMA
jgi:hypothetical protein